MIKKYWKGLIKKGFLNIEEAYSLSKRSTNKRGCCIWLGRTDRTNQPIFYSISIGHDVNVRPFLAKRILHNINGNISMKCLKKHCIHPKHMIFWKRSTRLTNRKTEKTLKELALLYPLTYLNRFYKISKYKLKLLKRQISGIINEEQ